jgi:predicted DCC family thiol-disulfide oxidoreductase YuxK
MLTGEKIKPVRELSVVYDGECPFCSNYVQHVRLQKIAGHLKYIDARGGGPIVEDAIKRGFNLDDGMLVIVDGAYHHGADAVHIIAMLSSPVDVLNRLNARLFRSRSLARLLYPGMRGGRNLTLALLGRKKIMGETSASTARRHTVTELKKYRIRKYVGPLLVAGYVSIVFYTGGLDTRPERFPFFNWSLFSYSSVPRTDVALEMHSVNGQPLPAPRLYYQMTDTFTHARERDVNLWKTEWALVSALRRNDQPTILQMRQIIEQRYMAEASSADYNIVQLTYDPIQRLRWGEIERSTVLASYSKSTPQ